VGPFPNDHLPPPTGYAAVDNVHRYGPVDEIQLRGSSHAQFSSQSPPPPSVPGAFTVHGFSSIIGGALYINGAFIDNIIADALSMVLVEFDELVGTDRYFDTELLQLDVSGGNLPPNILIRESPTLASLGRTAIRDAGGGQFLIASFFDVFTELSLDGGASWIPSNGSVRMQAVPEPALLTLLALGAAASRARRSRARRKSA
jgi:hypothetical protein